MGTDTYKKFEDIPELSTRKAQLHLKCEYTYIVNAEKYQKDGTLEVKRVLKKDLAPEASASYIFFQREGCHEYPLKEQDLYLKNPRGYVGPFQMNRTACNDYLAHIKRDHPELASYVKGNGTLGYMNFVKQCPDKEFLLNDIEKYALSDYFKGRTGTPKDITRQLANRFNLRTTDTAQPDSTRLPLHVIASVPTGIIARGNGKKFEAAIPNLYSQQKVDSYCEEWISCSTKSQGYKAYCTLKEINYLTPDVIAQYQTMGLSGADEFAEKYQNLVDSKEKEIRETLKNDIKITLPTASDYIKIPEISISPIHTPLQQKNR